MFIYLSRYESTDRGTFGVLVADDLVLHTIEKPWRNNAPFVSCIPAGEYELRPFTRQNGQKVYALESYLAGVTLKKEQHSKRYAILIHPGNTEADVVGCIAPGLSRTDNMVTHSKEAVSKLFDAMSEDQYNTILIAWGEVEV